MSTATQVRNTPSETPNAPASTPVPLLDIGRQNAPLKDSIQEAIRTVSESGAFVHGPDCKKLEAAIAEYCNTKHAVGCASGSDALLLALMVLGIGPGDEVLLPSFTFFATASAVTRLGATPVFVDIEPDTFNMCPKDTAAKITPNSKAILAVHLFGQCADMAALGELAKTNDLELIEDAAQSIGAEINGQRSGSFGTMGCYSFYPTKNLGAFGDGGMITTNDDKLAEKLVILRDHGQSPRYHHHIVGVNSRLDTIQAAVLNTKLPLLDGWSEARDNNANRYNEQFATSTFSSHIIAPVVTQGYKSIWNQYTVRVANGQRDALQAYLAERKIGSAIYYPVPLHMQECFADVGCKAGSLPETERAAEEVLSLPIFPELTLVEQQTVITAMETFCQQASVSTHAA